MIHRRILIALLALGTFVGYGSAIAHAVHHHLAHAHAHECAGWHHDAHDGHGARESE